MLLLKTPSCDRLSAGIRRRRSRQRETRVLKVLASAQVLKGPVSTVLVLGCVGVRRVSAAAA